MCEVETMSSRDPGRNPRQVFGAMVRFYRERAGVSRSELARQLCKSESLVQAIELGQRAATPQVTDDLEVALSAGGVLAKLRDEMGNGLSYQAYPSWFQDWANKEAEATTLRFFEPLIVPGLLQTEDYARAIFRTRLRTTEEEIDELVAARMRRQKILTRNDPAMLWVVIDEAVLRRQVGGRHVMREQITRLADAARQPTIVVEVVPQSVGAYLGLLGAFAIAEFEGVPSVGYQDGAVCGHPVEEPEDVEALGLIWDTLRTETLPRAASLALLEEAAKSWSSAA
jgi:transcriptional regulator with XRE-family HTH domain